jgi:hypothetical protein
MAHFHRWNTRPLPNRGDFPIRVDCYSASPKPLRSAVVRRARPVTRRTGLRL